MSRLSMRFLGSYQVHLDGELVATLAYVKVRALLAYLAVEAGRPHRREKLGGLLWPDLDERRARHNLSQALLTLRRALGEEGAASFLIATPDVIRFDAASDHWLDVSAFTSLLGMCEAHPHWRLETCPVCGQHLERASALYRGPFLEGFSLGDSAAFEEWQSVWRERLHREATDALRALARGCDHRGERDAALCHAERWVAFDPWHEGAQRQLMRSLALSGRRSEAVTQYQACCRTLYDELRVDPTRETVALYEAIREQEPLPDLFPPLPNNLPAPTTPFVGREELLDELMRRLQDPVCRLVTLVGPGGSGKTRLALQVGAKAVAEAATDCFPDGVYLIALASLHGGDRIASAIAQALGIGLAPGEDPGRGLLSALRRKRLLLILDNYEHLLDGPHRDQLCGARAATDILAAAPGIKVLVTSRARLNVLAEHVLPVGGMDFPQPHPENSEEIARHSAVALFLERARAVQPTFAPAGEKLGQVGRICRLLEGMPLAVVLAASWMDVFSPDEIAERVATNLHLLAADLEDLPARQHSMRAVFDASWASLSDQARAAFARMSVFCGGFTEQAAGAVAGAGLRTLRELVRTSFLYQTEAHRFEIHELLRQYGAWQLDKLPPHREEALDGHCAYYATFHEQRAPDVWKGDIGPVMPEIGNIRAAWHRALERGRTAQIRKFLGHLIGGLHQLYYSLGWFTEAAQTFAQAVRVLRASERSRENEIALGIALRYEAQFAAEIGCDKAPLPLIEESIAILRRAGAMEEVALSQVYAAIYRPGQDEAESERLLLESLAIARDTNCAFGIGWASHLLADLALRRQADDQAEAYLRDALKAFRRIEHRRGISWVLGSLADLASWQGDYVQARALAAESMALCEEIGWPWRVIEQLLFLGQLALAQGAGDEGRTWYEEACARAQKVGDHRRLAFALCGLGDAELDCQDLNGARSAYRRALEIVAEDRDPALVWRAIVSLAMLAAREECPERAASLLALAQRTAIEMPASMFATPLRRTYARLCLPRLHAALQRDLSPSGFTAAQERARTMSLPATIDELLVELGQ